MRINFADLEEKFSGYDASLVIILPVSYEGTVTYRKGTAKGAKAIIRASRQLELYEEETGFEAYRVGIHTAKKVSGNGLSPEEIIDRVYARGRKLLDDGKFIVMIGGEHSLSIGMVKAFNEEYRDLSILQLDAHADLREEYGGSRHSHACVGKRILDFAPLTLLGVRSLRREDADYISQTERLNVFYAGKNIGEKRVADKIISTLSENVYLTIDLDFLDPSIMPSVGNPEPGGVSWTQAMKFFGYLAQRRNVVGFDVVELAPLPENIAPDFLAAKLIYKLLTYIIKKKAHRHKG
ncbi:MAG: N(1)-aminopropylagmatine ureohydrolase [Firmicutes bacterium]|nr:N(1)-aminopropylagmatine ureohydrolase [Bacillota bacterium]